MLKHTKAPAMLIGCCFVNDKDDTKIYDHYKIAKEIVKGIEGDYYNVVGLPIGKVYQELKGLL